MAKMNIVFQAAYFQDVVKSEQCSHNKYKHNTVVIIH